MQCMPVNIILPFPTGKRLSPGKMSLPGIFIVPTVNLIFPVCRVVQEIPHQRMSQICHMHADLVGSPGLQLKFYQTAELLCISGLPSGQNPVQRSSCLAIGASMTPETGTTFPSTIARYVR